MLLNLTGYKIKFICLTGQLGCAAHLILGAQQTEPPPSQTLSVPRAEGKKKQTNILPASGNGFLFIHQQSLNQHDMAVGFFVAAA